jgi:hypothetical protein
VKELECKRCGHRWIPRTAHYPKVCAKCKSPYWNKQRKKEAEAEMERKRELARMPMGQRFAMATARAEQKRAEDGKTKDAIKEDPLKSAG